MEKSGLPEKVLRVPVNTNEAVFGTAKIRFSMDTKSYEGEVVVFSTKRLDRSCEKDLIDSATPCPCHNSQVVGLEMSSNAISLTDPTVLAAKSELDTTAPQRLQYFENSLNDESLVSHSTTRVSHACT